MAFLTKVKIQDTAGNAVNNGQQTMANSLPIAIASNQSAIPTSLASVPLPTGASTSALQTTGNTSVGSIDTKTPSLGQAAMAASSPVVIASNQSAIPVNQGTAAALGSAWPTKVSDGVDFVGISTVGGAKALKVDVIQTVGGGGSGTSSAFAAAFPATGTAVGFSDGTNMQGARVFDLDTGAGTEFNVGVSLRLAANGGSFELGTVAHPIFVNPVPSANIQAISGAVNQGTAAGSAGNWPVRLTDGTNDVGTTAVGSKFGLNVANTTGDMIQTGQSIYSNATGDFTATANAGVKTITLSAYTNSVLSAQITANNFMGAVIKRRTNGNVVDFLPLTSIAFAANVLTLSDMAAGFNAGDTVAVFVPGPDKTYNAISNYNSVSLATQIAGEDLANNVQGVMIKPLPTNAFSYTPYFNFGSSANDVVKGTPGNVFSAQCHNLNAATRFLQLHNAIAPVAGGAVPQYSIAIPTGATVLVGTDFFGAGGENFTLGIVFAFSTTEGTFTAGVAADQSTLIRIK